MGKMFKEALQYKFDLNIHDIRNKSCEAGSEYNLQTGFSTVEWQSSAKPWLKSVRLVIISGWSYFGKKIEGWNPDPCLSPPPVLYLIQYDMGVHVHCLVTDQFLQQDTSRTVQQPRVLWHLSLHANLDNTNKGGHVQKRMYAVC